MVRSAPEVASLRPSIDQPRPRTEERWPERSSLVLSVGKEGTEMPRSVSEVRSLLLLEEEGGHALEGGYSDSDIVARTRGYMVHTADTVDVEDGEVSLRRC